MSHTKDPIGTPLTMSYPTQDYTGVPLPMPLEPHWPHHVPLKTLLTTPCPTKDLFGAPLIMPSALPPYVTPRVADKSRTILPLLPEGCRQLSRAPELLITR